MYTLVKLFDKGAITPGEVIQRFHFGADGIVFAVETDKSIYQLVKV